MKMELVSVKFTPAGSTVSRTMRRGRRPGVLRRCWWFARAFIRHAFAGFPTVNPVIRRNRMATCMACPEFDSAKTTCRKCGCGLRTKTAWALERCPLGLW